MMFNFPKDLKVETGRRAFIVRRRRLDDYINVLSHVINNGPFPNQKGKSSIVNSSWSGIPAKDYLHMLQHGWPEGIADAEGLDGLSTDVAERLQLRPSVAGCFANVPAHLAGHPASMYEIRKHESEQRSVTLLVDSSFNCSVDTKTALAYAHKVMRLVAWLQAQQIDTAVYSAITVGLNVALYCYPITIREWGQVLQPERIAAILHPSWLRRAWFAMLECDAYRGCKHAQSAVHGAYGRTNTGNAELWRAVFPDAAAIIELPKVGKGDPEKAVREALNLKIRRSN